MKVSRYLALPLFTGALLFVGLAPADDKKESPSGSIPEVKLTDKEKQAQQDIEDLGTAYRLSAIGDPEDKDKPKCPEMLLSAAFLYRKVAKSQMTKLDVKPEISNDKGSGSVTDKEGKAPDYAKEADKLIDRAREIAAEKKLGKEIEALIKDLDSRKLDRAVVDGPRHVSRVIGAGETQTYRIKVEPWKPFSVAFRATRNLRVEVVREDNANVFAAGIVPFGSAVHTPGGPPKGKEFVPVTVRFKNETGGPVEYTLTMQ